MEFRSKEDKRVIVSRAISLTLLFAVVVFVLVYVGYRIQSLAWFAAGTNVSASGMEVAVQGPTYEILVERTHEYDSLINNDPNYPKYNSVDLLKASLTADGFDTDTYTSTADSKLALELVNEEHFTEGGIDFYTLRPGSCGTLTFYLRPYDGDVMANIELNLGAFFDHYVGDDFVTTEVTDTAVLDLMRGHFLFFTGRNGADTDHYKYSGLLTDGTFTYNTADHTLCTEEGKTDCYKITLYWEWVYSYETIYENTGAGQRYPTAVADFVEASPACFFATNQNSTDLRDRIDGYNDGDQTIGDNASFIVAYIGAN